VNSLEEYILNVTEPFDFTGFQKEDDLNIIIEKIIPESGESKLLIPRIPEHSSGSQHLNFGLDLFSAENSNSKEINSCYHYAILKTGIRIELPFGYHMMVGSRSGLGFKQHIQAFPGIIDHSYRGEILIKLYSPLPFEISAGDKIAQGLIFSSLPYNIVEGVVNIDTERGERGFGSTDK